MYSVHRFGKGERKGCRPEGQIEGVGVAHGGLSPSSSLVFVLVPLALELNERLTFLENSVCFAGSSVSVENY